MPRGRPPAERVTVTCTACGKDIIKREKEVAHNKSGRFFCDTECLRKVGSKPRTVPRKKCEQCGNEFASYGKRGGRFCKKECYDEWQRRRRVKKVCEECGEEFWLKPSQVDNVTGRWCKRACEAASRIKRPLDRQHNRRPAVLDHLGYVRVYEPDHPRATKAGWQFEHRIVVEEHLGRRLGPDEHVHHVNGVKSDNRLENLVVMSHGEHSSITGLANGERLREWAEYRKLYGPLEQSR